MGHRRCDLKNYVTNHRIRFSDPAQKTPHYVAVNVSARGDINDGQGGDEEVALDQEAILATAPDATQVAYFASNSDGGDGYFEAIRQVGDRSRGTSHRRAVVVVGRMRGE